MTTLQIGDTPVGAGHAAYIIAEAGANHDRDLEVAHQLIDVAADARANAIKFQTYSAETMYSKFTPRLSEMDAFDRAASDETPFDLIKRNELPREWHRELFEHARERDLDFLSTPFDLPAVEELADLGVNAFKIASYELTDFRLLRAAAAHGLPMIVSTGNSGIGDVERAVETIRCAGNERIVLLHCVSQYPAEAKDVNIRAMSTLAQAFQVTVGFSDHTMGTTSAILAVALGASVFEKHFTLSRDRKGPDHPSAAEPEELVAYISQVREAETAMGSPMKRVQPSEEENHRLARRSLHAAADIAAGTVITPEMLIVKRPALGIDPGLEDVVVGRQASRHIKADEWITWDMV